MPLEVQCPSYKTVLETTANSDPLRVELVSITLSLNDVFVLIFKVWVVNTSHGNYHLCDISHADGGPMKRHPR